MRRVGLHMGLAVLGAITLLGYTGAQAYEEAPVSDGATLSGKVTFKGTPPPPKTFELAKFPQPQFCGKVDNDGQGHRILREVSVKDGNLKDVVVFIEGIEKGKPMKFNGTDVHADNCRFLVQGGPSTYVGVVMKKAEIRIQNMDADPSDPKSVTGVLHNPHGYEVFGASNNTMFNLPLPDKGMTIKKPVILRKKESVMKLECDQHNYMNAWFYPVENPYYAVVGEDGSFTIDGIPPGTYEVYAWHPILGKQEQKITFTAGGKGSANFAFAAK